MPGWITPCDQAAVEVLGQEARIAVEPPFRFDEAQEEEPGDLCQRPSVPIIARDVCGKKVDRAIEQPMQQPEGPPPAASRSIASASAIACSSAHHDIARRPGPAAGDRGSGSEDAMETTRTGAIVTASRRRACAGSALNRRPSLPCRATPGTLARVRRLTLETPDRKPGQRANFRQVPVTRRGPGVRTPRRPGGGPGRRWRWGLSPVMRRRIAPRHAQGGDSPSGCRFCSEGYRMMRPCKATRSSWTISTPNLGMHRQNQCLAIDALPDAVEPGGCVLPRTTVWPNESSTLVLNRVVLP